MNQNNIYNPDIFISLNWNTNLTKPIYAYLFIFIKIQSKQIILRLKL